MYFYPEPNYTYFILLQLHVLKRVLTTRVGRLKVLFWGGGGVSYGTTCIVSITIPQFNFKSLLSSPLGDNVLAQ